MASRIVVYAPSAPVRRALCEALDRRGHQVEGFGEVDRAIARSREVHPDVVLVASEGPVDPEGVGRLRGEPPRPLVLIGVEETLEGLGKLRPEVTLAWPCAPEIVVRAVARVLSAGSRGLDRLIGKASAMQRLHRQLRQIAPSRAPVLITGEPGCGKELAAVALHELSLRASGPFVRLDCGALDALVPSDSDARDAVGAIVLAEGGTLFLDEIADLSVAAQVQLLALLSKNEVAHVGQTVRLDVRVIAASRHDLARAVREGCFREELYYRLAVVTLGVPPLRTRGPDVVQIAEHVLRRVAADNGRPVVGMDDETRDCLLWYGWPGNVRELENAITRAVLVARGPLVVRGDLPPAVRDEDAGDAPHVPGASLDDLERYAILKTLEHTGGCKAQAARILGISHRKIQYKLHEYRATARQRRSSAPPMEPRVSIPAEIPPAPRAKA